MEAKPDAEWVLIFSDGTGQRGVPDRKAPVRGLRNTSIFRMYEAVQTRPDIRAFYDPGLGTPEHGQWGWARWGLNLWSKATGWGITTNIVDCYEALLALWQPGMKVGLFGFSRGAYTVRSLGGVLKACGIATRANGAAFSGRSAKDDPEGGRLRRRVAQQAVDIYKISPKTRGPERDRLAAEFRQAYAASATEPTVIGVFDTVKALKVPGTGNVTDPFKHHLHDHILSENVPVGLQALAIDEDREAFRWVEWEERIVPGQFIEQKWFPGVHSDIGGAYATDTRLGDHVLAWMLDRLAAKAGLVIDIPLPEPDKVLGAVNSNRIGVSRLLKRAPRRIPLDRPDFGDLCEDIERRFHEATPPYRPSPLAKHPKVAQHYLSQPASDAGTGPGSAHREPKMAEPTRTSVAPNRTAST